MRFMLVRRCFLAFRVELAGEEGAEWEAQAGNAEQQG